MACLMRRRPHLLGTLHRAFIALNGLYRFVRHTVVAATTLLSHSTPVDAADCCPQAAAAMQRTPGWQAQAGVVQRS